MILEVSGVSNHVQMMTNKLVKGRAQSKAPHDTLRFDNSEAAVITAAEIINFRMIG
jgi:hypothetical protein